MASYQILYWGDIPAQVKARDELGTEKRILPARFQEAIDSVAMAESKTSSDAYLDGWRWSKQEERAGSAAEVAEAILADLDATYPEERLREIVLSHTRK